MYIFKLNRIVFISLLCLLTTSCGRDVEGSDKIIGQLNEAYMPEDDWKAYLDRPLHSEPATDMTDCELLSLSDLLDLLRSEDRHAWLTKNSYHLAQAQSAKSTGNVLNDITEYTSLQYKSCEVPQNRITGERGVGTVSFQVRKTEDLSYSVAYAGRELGPSIGKQLVTEYDDKYARVTYIPTQGKKTRDAIYYIDGVFLFFSYSGYGLFYQLTRNPSKSIRNWNDDWRAGNYKIPGNPYQLEVVENTVPLSISGRKVSQYMNDYSDAIIIDLRTMQQRAKGTPYFKDRVLYISGLEESFKGEMHKLDNSKQYLLLTQDGTGERQQTLARDQGLTNFIQVKGGYDAMYGESKPE